MKTITNRDELLTTYRNSNLFIEAGAGAGKTQFISNKTTDLILQGVKVDQIILITFTNKAAEEMLSRISKDLTKKIEIETNIDIKNKLIEAKNNLYRLNVSTIHSFCNKLLNENSFLAKLPYNFTLIDEEEEEKRRNDLFSSYFKLLQEEDFNNINSIVFVKNRINAIKNKFINLCQYFPNQEINSDVPSDEEYYSYILSINDLYKMIDSFSSKLGANFNAQANKFINEYNSFINNVGDLNKENLVKCLSHSLDIEKLKNLIKKYHGAIGIKGISKDSSSDLIKYKEDFNKELEKFNIYRNLKDKMETYQYKYINKYAKLAFEFYNKNCKKDQLSNNQLIYYTYQLLIDKSSNKVRETLGKKYNSIFVDEFQDTDKYQIKFIDELVKAINDRKQKEGINNTTLIVVGDPKQSIYRFRGADINSFIAYRDDNSFKKEVLYLPDNYRSSNLIINYLNETYSDPNKKFHLTYKYENMLVSPNNDINKEKIKTISDIDNVLAGVYSYPFNIDSENDNKFNRLVKLIKYLVDHQYKIYKRLNDKYDFYHISYSDFLILTHSKTEMNEYVKTFNRYKINVNVAGEYNLTSSYLFNLVYSLINYVFDPNINNYLDIKSRFMFAKGEELDNYLSSLTKDIKNMTPYGQLMYIFNTLLSLRFYIKGFIDSDVNTYETIIHQVLEQINININADKIHLLNELDKLRKTPSEQQLNLDNKNECVRIMNMHKSKGLEGNIVIVPDSGSSKKDSRTLLYKDVVYLSANNFSNEIKTRNEEEEKEERLRLEYVVASRAKSVLIFESEFSNNSYIFSSKDYDFSNKYLKKFQLNLSNSNLPSEEEISEYFKLDLDNLDKIYEISSTKEFRLKNYKEVLTPRFNAFSPSLKENHEEVSIIENDTRVILRPRNNIFGDCLHRAMEILINDYSKDIKEIAIQVVNERIEDISTNEITNYINYVSKCVSAIKSLYDKDAIIKDYEAYPEYKFCTFIKEENSLINGSIDLFLIKDNHIKIIDYKSDIAGFKDCQSFENILKSRYKPQLDFYKKVVSNLYPSYSIDTSIIYIEEDNDNEIAHQISI